MWVWVCEFVRVHFARLELHVRSIIELIGCVTHRFITTLERKDFHFTLQWRVLHLWGSGTYLPKMWVGGWVWAWLGEDESGVDQQLEQGQRHWWSMWSNGSDNNLFAKTNKQKAKASDFFFFFFFCSPISFHLAFDRLDDGSLCTL